MRVWTNRDFPGFYPVGTAAVVVADTVEQATELLNDRLEETSLGRVATAEQFQEMQTNAPLVLVLRNGDY